MKQALPVKIDGFVAPGFELVAEAFSLNFKKHEEIGAAFAAYHHGERVVDIWGGVADATTDKPWAHDTLQLIFSGTKALVATLMIMLIDQNIIDLNAPISHYWPEFGKEHILIRHLLTHEAGLPGIEVPLSPHDLTNGRRMAELLAAQLPSTDPRAARCYHAVTFGWMCGEIVRRTCGRSLGQMFDEMVARPLDLDIWIGLPAKHAHQVSRIAMDQAIGTPHILDPAIWAHDPLLLSIWGNPPLLDPNRLFWNEPEWQQCEIPSLNAVVTARSVAKLFGCLSQGGAPLISPQGIKLASTTLTDWHDEAHQFHWPYSAGFQLQNELYWFGPVPNAFGLVGAGGSIHGAWSDHGIGFSYCMNLLREPAEERDMRGAGLLAALYRAMENRQ